MTIETLQQRLAAVVADLIQVTKERDALIDASIYQADIYLHSGPWQWRCGCISSARLPAFSDPLSFPTKEDAIASLVKHVMREKEGDLS